MKYYIFICLLSLASTKDFTLIDEIIRRKVENLPEFHTLNKEYEILCIPSIREVYLTNNFDPYWLDTKKINEFLSIIEKCQDEGLNPEDYHLSDIYELKERDSGENNANLDIILTDAFLLFTSHILSGKTNPVTIDPEWHVIKTDKNPVKYMYQIKTKNITEIISEILPKNKNYEALKNKLKLYREYGEKEIKVRIPKGQILKPGMEDHRIMLIRESLTLTKDYTFERKSNYDYYDDTLKTAVINFQKRHGLEALGTIGDQTIEVLNMPFSERIKSIEVNLERLRWLPQELPNYYCMVNIVNYELEVVENNVIARTHKVIVGKPFRKTPVFSSTMQYIVFNPTWTVPPTILKNDLIPEIIKNKEYLTRKKIDVYNSFGEKLNPDSIDWKSKIVYSYTYRQEPGKDNALGLVKFVFPNKFNVYLHDTPGKELFNKTERAFSSGCIRVQQPLELAEYLLKDQKGYSLQELRKITETAKTQTVILCGKPEVYLLYLTTWVDDNSQINFRKDIYERDDRLYKALNAKPVYDIN